VSSARPLISAVIPSYNHSASLGHAIESILKQERCGDQFEIEVIVVDDASTDATGEVVSRYSQVRYLRHPCRGGVAAAMNTGIRASNGQYVSILGADDTWLPHKLRVQVPLIEAHPEVGVVYSQAIRRRGNVEELFPVPSRAPSGWVLDAMLTYSFAGHYSALLVRREAFEVAGYFDETLISYEDYDMSLRLAFRFQFLFEPGPVTIYNLSTNGLWLSRAASGGASRDYGRAIEKALQMLAGSDRYAKFAEQAPIRIALQAMAPFVVAGDLSRGWTALLAALREHPNCGRLQWARSYISWIVRKRLAEAESPVKEARKMCASIKNISANLGDRERDDLRSIMADIWMNVLKFDAARSRISAIGSASAAMQVLSYSPIERRTIARVGRMLLKR